VKEPSPQRVFAEKLSQAYEVLLEGAVEKAQQGGSVIQHLLDEIREDVTALSELSLDEIALLKAYVKRDLVDAATYIDATGKELKDWLGFDLTLIENDLLSKFSQATDKTTLELLQIQQQAALAPYNTGELTGIGTLVCGQCGTKLHFHKPGHIPPCAKCHDTHFHRETFTASA